MKILYSIQLVEACYCKYRSLIFYDFIELVSSFLFVQSVLMDCSRIPVNKGTSPMVDKKGSLYQIVYPSCDLDKLCVLAGANVSENQNERGSWTSVNKTKERYFYIRCCFVCVSGMIIIYHTSKARERLTFINIGLAHGSSKTRGAIAGVVTRTSGLVWMGNAASVVLALAAN